MGILTRVIPHPPNMTAIGAIALFGGAFFQDRRLAFAVPILTMLMSDFILGYQLNIAVYMSFIGIVFLGFTIKAKQTISRVFNTSILASLIFFIITNFSVFLYSPLYPNNIIGLLECYTLAIPFFINTLIGNIIYTFIMFYSYKFIKNKIAIKTR